MASNSAIKLYHYCIYIHLNAFCKPDGAVVDVLESGGMPSAAPLMLSIAGRVESDSTHHVGRLESDSDSTHGNTSEKILKTG